MTLLKKGTVISDNLLLTDYSSTVTTISFPCTTGFAKHVFIKIKNDPFFSKFTPTTGIFQTSTDNINFYDFYTITGSLAINDTVSTSFQVPAPVQYIRMVWIPGGGGFYSIVRAEYSEIKEKAESFTDPAGGLIPVGTILTDLLDVSNKILVELARIRIGMSVLTNNNLGNINNIDA